MGSVYKTSVVAHIFSLMNDRLPHMFDIVVIVTNKLFTGGLSISYK
jgi:hypothetical protein